MFQNKIDCVMGKLSRYDTLYLGADKPAFDLPQIREQIDRLEQSETELDEIGALIHEIEVGLFKFLYLILLMLYNDRCQTNKQSKQK